MYDKVRELFVLFMAGAAFAHIFIAPYYEGLIK